MFSACIDVCNLFDAFSALYYFCLDIFFSCLDVYYCFLVSWKNLRRIGQDKFQLSLPRSANHVLPFLSGFFLCARQHETFYKTFPTHKKCLCKSEFPFGTTSILIVDWYKSIPIPNHLNIYATTWRSAPQYLPPALPLD